MEVLVIVVNNGGKRGYRLFDYQSKLMGIVSQVHNESLQDSFHQQAQSAIDYARLHSCSFSLKLSRKLQFYEKLCVFDTL
jgi:hypothetical protein